MVISWSEVTSTKWNWSIAPGRVGYDVIWCLDVVHTYMHETCICCVHRYTVYLVIVTDDDDDDDEKDDDDDVNNNMLNQSTPFLLALPLYLSTSLSHHDSQMVRADSLPKVPCSARSCSESSHRVPTTEQLRSYHGRGSSRCGGRWAACSTAGLRGGDPVRTNTTVLSHWRWPWHDMIWYMDR